MVNMTSRNAILNALHLLATDPCSRDRLKHSYDSFFNDVLTTSTPLQRAPKRAVRDTVLGGQFLPQDTTLILLLGAAAGSCPQAVADKQPSASSLHSAFGSDKHPSASSPHIAFGSGAHACLGRHVVRAEMEAIVNYVLKRAPSFRVVGTPERMGHMDVGNYGWSKLQFSFHDDDGDGCPEPPCKRART
jgi:cytochrome P450